MLVMSTKKKQIVSKSLKKLSNILKTSVKTIVEEKLNLVTLLNIKIKFEYEAWETQINKRKRKINSHRYS